MNKMLINIDPSLLNKLKDHFNPYLINLNNDEAFFHAVRNNSRITAYHTGLIEIIGSGSLAIYNDINYTINNIFYPAYGITCEGLNDIFGPLVLCSTYISEDSILELEKFELDITKKLSDYQISKIAPYLMSIIEHNFVIIEAKKYNQMLDKNIRKDQILSHYAYEVIAKIKNKELIIVDSFVENANFFSVNQHRRAIDFDFAFYENAVEAHYSAYLSQIIARYIFLQKMKEYSNNAKVYFIKGSTDFAKNQYLELSESNADLVYDYAKKNFI